MSASSFSSTEVGVGLGGRPGRSAWVDARDDAGPDGWTVYALAGPTNVIPDQAERPVRPGARAATGRASVPSSSRQPGRTRRRTGQPGAGGPPPALGTVAEELSKWGGASAADGFSVDFTSHSGTNSTENRHVPPASGSPESSRRSARRSRHRTRRACGFLTRGSMRSPSRALLRRPPPALRHARRRALEVGWGLGRRRVLCRVRVAERDELDNRPAGPATGSPESSRR